MRDKNSFDDYPVLSEIKLSSLEQKEIWDSIEHRMEHTNPKKGRFAMFKNVAAVVAALALFSGGFRLYLKDIAIPNGTYTTASRYQKINQSPLYVHLNSYLQTYYSTQQISNLFIYHSTTVGLYAFTFITYDVNETPLFATVVSNTVKPSSVVNFAPSVPVSKSSPIRPFDNIESGGILFNHQTYFVLGGHVNDRSITSIKVTLNFKNGIQKSTNDVPISKEGLYFLFSKDADGTSSVTGYNKAGNVVYKVGR